MKIGISVIILVTLFWVGGAQARRSNCPQSRDLQMDECASRMGFLGDHSFVVPKNASSMAAFCSRLKESIGCVQSYSRDCLTGFTRQILGGLLKRGKQQFQSICNQGSSRANFMSKMGCLTDQKIQTFHSCIDGSIGRFEFIASEVKADNKLPTLCCSYQIFFADTNQTVNELCGANNEANRYVQNLVSGTTGEFVQLICDGHRSMADCRTSSKTKGNLDRLEEITRAAKSGKLKPHSKSLIPPLLEILDSSE